jgi:hypothetical protein
LNNDHFDKRDAKPHTRHQSSHDELAAFAKHYPNCVHAIAWTELIICSPVQDGGDPEPTWDMMMRAVPPIRPEEIVELLKDAAADSDPESMPMRDQIVAQMSHPEFLTYVKGKAGCV